MQLRTLLDRPGPLIIAHRGDSRAAPENTLPAFLSALRVGADVVELDYVHTADGVPIVFHDETLDRTTDACQLWNDHNLRIADTPLARLRQLDAGRWFDARVTGTRLSTLEEALAAVTPSAPMMIERKAGDAATTVELLTRGNWLDLVTVQAFDWDFLAECRRLAPQLVIGALGDGPLDDRRLKMLAVLKPDVVGWDTKSLTAEAIEAINTLGCKAWSWTVDDFERARQLVSWGLHGVITNLPGQMRRELLS